MTLAGEASSVLNEGGTTQYVALLAALQLTAFSVWHFAQTGLYATSRAWQLSILTAHSSALVALRWNWDLSVYDFAGFYAAAACWLLLLLCLRRQHASSLYGLAILLMEVAIVFVPISYRLLCLIAALNSLIPFAYWTAMWMSTLAEETAAFGEVDAHMRKGLQHVFSSEAARYSLAANIIVHGAMQFCVVLALGPVTMPPSCMRDLLVLLSLYWLLASLVTAGLGTEPPYPVPRLAGMALCAFAWSGLLSWAVFTRTQLQAV
eukprot:TRINITY_DN84176_c0_g1_i1.p1 TRINITY_DN84176_c0_g1~~TRINITY_DN84176_c0_g1_i1.p1  ORF type:complete len:263 (-),score=43.38 TRINITY_DN84176_c0_g1_i1:34-822(-)